MTEFIIANMAPIIFISMIFFLLVGFPVAFALAANGVVFGLLSVVVILFGGLLVIAAAGSHSAVAIGVVIALLVFAVMLLALVQAALQGIYAAAIYRYAEEGAASPGFDRVLITNAFQSK